MGNITKVLVETDSGITISSAFDKLSQSSRFELSSLFNSNFSDLMKRTSVEELFTGDSLIVIKLVLTGGIEYFISKDSLNEYVQDKLFQACGVDANNPILYYVVVAPDGAFCVSEASMTHLLPMAYDTKAIRKSMTKETEPMLNLDHWNKIDTSNMLLKIKESQHKCKVVVKEIYGLPAPRYRVIADNVLTHYAKKICQILKKRDISVEMMDIHNTLKVEEGADTVKLVGSDNFCRDDHSDMLIADNVDRELSSIIKEGLLAEMSENDSICPDMKENSYVLYTWEP